MKTFLTTLLLFGPFAIISVNGFTAYTLQNIDSCDDRDRFFEVCPENQGADIYAKAISEVHKRGKDALIVYGYVRCVWCNRLHGMLSAGKFFADIRQKIDVIPISTYTHIETLEGNAIYTSNPTSQEYFQRLGFSDSKEWALPQLILVKQSGEALHLLITEELERNFQSFWLSPRDGEYKKREDGSFYTFNVYGFDVEKIKELINTAF